MNELGTLPADAVGLFDDVPAREYHARPEISKHGLDAIARNPARFVFDRSHEKDPTPAMRWGSLVDMAIFEPERFAIEVATIPDDAPARPALRSVNAKKPRPEVLEAAAWWDVFDRENLGKEMLTSEETRQLRGMQEAIHAHPAASRLLGGGGRSQVSMFWVDPETGMRCRGRPDRLHPQRIIVDLKTTVSAAPDDFQKSVWNFRYDVQAAFYLDGYTALTGEPPMGFVFLAVEKEPPYQVACYIATPAMIEAGRKRYRRDLETYARCLAEGQWPGYGDNVMPLDLPAWAHRSLNPNP